jgi:hypothetical protein
MRLAAALMEAGRAAEAVKQYEACMQGPFAQDAELILGAARAKLANAEADAAILLLSPLQMKQPNYRAEEVGLMLGRAYAACGLQQDAGVQFETVVERFGSIEARVELALWAIANGKDAVVQRELKEIEHARRHMAKHTLDLHQDLFTRVDAATGQR